jgi:acetyltransferase-like isoleucine patch superfamily enzyme
MVQRIIRKISKTFTGFALRKDPESIIKGFRPRGKNFKGVIRLSEKSSLTIGRNVTFSGVLIIKEASHVVIEDECSLTDVRFNVTGNSKIHLGKGAVLCAGPLGYLNVDILNGTFILEGYNKIMSLILVKFGGVLTIGKFSGIGQNSEIRCEESVTIGSHGLFSYEVSIYDSDTHSTDWEKRRERIEAGYPVGASEIEKPKTRPVIIGDDVWLGKGVTITKGTKIGNRCIVGIGTVVGGGEYADDTTIVSDKPRIITRANE